jgi:5-methylcytosine-specific restriction endonuclease McrBC regulatory subunit McrC
MSYSFEELYQAVRRSWRFKQEHPVNVYLIVAETEGEILATVQKKMAGHEEMLDALIEATKVAQGRGDLLLTPYDPREEMVIPHWLRSVA